MLAQSMLDNGLYDEGYFVFLSPELNYQTQAAADAYTSHLKPNADGKVRFVSVTLEDAVETIRLSVGHDADLGVAARACFRHWHPWGESGLNIVANDPVHVAVARDKPAQLSELKALLDAGEITSEQYGRLKAEILS